MPVIYNTDAKAIEQALGIEVGVSKDSDQWKWHFYTDVGNWRYCYSRMDCWISAIHQIRYDATAYRNALETLADDIGGLMGWADAD